MQAASIARLGMLSALTLIDDWSTAQAIKDLKSSDDVGADALNDRGVHLFVRAEDI